VTPFVNPSIVQFVVATTQVCPPGDAVAVYDVTDAPPSSAGALQETSTDSSPVAADTATGAEGICSVGVASTTSEGSLTPTEFVAVTVNE
jgi:hypothetical protein